jgi:hypothetical protein
MSDDSSLKKPTMMEKWLRSLPPHVQEIIVASGETLEQFDGDVRMMSTLATLTFMRAVDASAGKIELSPKDHTDLLRTAGLLVRGAAKVKMDRLDTNEKFSDIASLPKPANIEYVEFEGSPSEKVKRLLLVGMEEEARVMAKQYGVDFDQIRAEVEDQHG